MESGTRGACLSVPIIRLGTHVGLKIYFFLHLTGKGYGLRVSRDMYDGMYDKPFHKVFLFQVYILYSAYSRKRKSDSVQELAKQLKSLSEKIPKNSQKIAPNNHG